MAGTPAVGLKPFIQLVASETSVSLKRAGGFIIFIILIQLATQIGVGRSLSGIDPTLEPLPLVPFPLMGPIGAFFFGTLLFGRALMEPTRYLWQSLPVRGVVIVGSQLIAFWLLLSLVAGADLLVVRGYNALFARRELPSFATERWTPLFGILEGLLMSSVILLFFTAGAAMRSRSRTGQVLVGLSFLPAIAGVFLGGYWLSTHVTASWIIYPSLTFLIIVAAGLIWDSLLEV